MLRNLIYTTSILKYNFNNNINKRLFSKKDITSARSLYDIEYKKSLFNPTEYWLEQAKKLKWFNEPNINSILTKDSNNYEQWFKNGKINASYLATDFHVNNRPKQIALIHDSPRLGIKSTRTYDELADEVARVAFILVNTFNVKKGDRVMIYMPMMIESVIAMLACTRIGAIHSVVFGGFAANEVAFRIKDLDPKLIISATGSIEVEKLTDYGKILDEAFTLPDFLNGDKNKKPLPVLFVDRPELRRKFPGMLASPKSWKSNYHNYNDLLAETKFHAPVCETDATDILYILYTSGTTGKPKGIVRDHGSSVAAKYAMDKIMDAKPGSVFFAASDIGWVVGHTFSVYGPLIQGCTSVIYEGKPVKYPNAGVFWRMIEEYKVSTFFAAPTAFRAIRKEDPEASFIKQYSISSLKNLFIAGERLDPPTLEWLKNHIKANVVDNWWQTESGWPMIALPMGITGSNNPLPIKAGSSSLPMPGFDIRVLDEAGKEVPRGESGNLVIKLPLPPSCMRTVWNDHKRFLKGYLEPNPGYYLTGDGGYIDNDGYVFIMGRVDDVINVAGHRLSTGQMEEIIAKHASIAECAVVAIPDMLKGDIPVAFVVVQDNNNLSNIQIAKDLVESVRKLIGPLACFKNVIFCKRLPKTRSGKILRKTIRQLSSETHVPIPATIDDPLILEEIRVLLHENKVGPLYADKDL